MNKDVELSETPMHSALNKENLLLGGERELVLVSALISVALGMLGHSLFSISAAGVIWVSSLYFLRRMALSDPELSKIYVRHLKSNGFFFAKSRPWRDL
ncbi:MAG: conjugal transfer protein TrbD [Proteobacteria bacterium]|nr:MAG: conjugal transfer protein TrbD [Pseudomonadota bacterium]